MHIILNELKHVIFLFFVVLIMIEEDRCTINYRKDFFQCWYFYQKYFYDYWYFSLKNKPMKVLGNKNAEKMYK